MEWERGLACENSCPSLLPVLVAFRETPLGPGAKKNGCFHRLVSLGPSELSARIMELPERGDPVGYDINFATQ